MGSPFQQDQRRLGQLDLAGGLDKTGLRTASPPCDLSVSRMPLEQLAGQNQSAGRLGVQLPQAVLGEVQ